MASNLVDVASRLESILQCAICLDVLKEPTNLACGHVFCEFCLRRLLGANGRIVRCPTCQRTSSVRSMTKAFVLKDVVDAQRSISSTPVQHACESCQQPSDIDDLWACTGCAAKILCSKCMIKNNHGKCDEKPRNLAEVLVEKRQAATEWRQATYEDGVAQLTSRICVFARRVEDMRRRITGLRDLLKVELLTQNGEKVLASFRSDMAAFRHDAGVFINLSANDQLLGDRLANCDQELFGLENRMRSMKGGLETYSQKFDQCFQALDVLTTSIRRILDAEIPLPDQANNIEVTQPAAETMIYDLGISATTTGAVSCNAPHLDDSIALIDLEDNQNTIGENSD